VCAGHERSAATLSLLREPDSDALLPSKTLERRSGCSTFARRGVRQRWHAGRVRDAPRLDVVEYCKELVADRGAEELGVGTFGNDGARVAKELAHDLEPKALVQEVGAEGAGALRRLGAQQSLGTTATRLSFDR
jgi:hypothetical protein